MINDHQQNGESKPRLFLKLRDYNLVNIETYVQYEFWVASCIDVLVIQLWKIIRKSDQ